jgi:hypothetical protein
MELAWIDLFTGRPPTATAPMFSGQWVVDFCQQGLRLNGVEAQVGDRLIADNRQRWSIELAGGSSTEGELPRMRPVTEGDVDALIRMEESLGELPRLDATWSDWAQASPLAPRIEDEIRIRPFDEYLEERLLFLEAVCRAPRNHLRIDADLQPVSRARRIAKQAVARLASHREDWERPTVLGVRPRRVLCLVPDEEFDLYENRVAARLVDHLRSYLANRLFRLSAVLRMMDESSDHADSARGAYWRQRERLFSIWGESIRDESATRIADATQRRIEAVYLRVLALLDSSLYRAVPRSARVTGLRYTNIFLNDSNYRQVAAIWREWSKEGLDRELSDQEKFQRGQRACSGMALYARVLVARALRQLGLTPSAPSAVPLSGSRPIVQLESRGAIATVTLEPNGTLLVATGCSALRVVPLATVNELEGGHAGSGSNSHGIESVDGEQILVLHLPTVAPAVGAGGEIEANVPATLLPHWSPSGLASAQPAALPVSPWSISSVERVARFFRWHLFAPTLAHYPPVISLPHQFSAQQRGWLKPAGVNRWMLLRRPEAAEESPESLAKQYAANEYKRLAARGGRAAQSARADSESAAGTIRVAFIDAFKRLGELERCPVCREQGGGIVSLGDDGSSFRVLCQNTSCESSWGCYACGGRNLDGAACGVQVPFITVQGFEDWMKSDACSSAAWAEARFGADLLTVPRREPSGKPRWLCAGCMRGRC